MSVDRMTAPTSRLLTLLSLLQARRDWPGALLAERLGVSHRTVRRDIDRLREMGYNVQATMGPDGGYRLDAGADLPPLLFDDDQALALALALALQTTAVAGSGLEEAALRALTTLRQLLPSRLRHRLDGLEVVPLPDRAGDAPPAPVSPDTLVEISVAIRAGRTLSFDYASGQGGLEPARCPAAGGGTSWPGIPAATTGAPIASTASLPGRPTAAGSSRVGCPAATSPTTSPPASRDPSRRTDGPAPEPSSWASPRARCCP
jgi:biotin operon repressor